MPPEERQNRSTANPDVGTKEYAEALHSWCTVAHINHIDEIVGPRFCKDQRAVCPYDFIHIGKLLEILMNPPYSCTNAMVFPNKFEQAVLKFLAEKPLTNPHTNVDNFANSFATHLTVVFGQLRQLVREDRRPHDGYRKTGSFRRKCKGNDILVIKQFTDKLLLEPPWQSAQPQPQAQPLADQAAEHTVKSCLELSTIELDADGYPKIFQRGQKREQCSPILSKASSAVSLMSVASTVFVPSGASVPIDSSGFPVFAPSGERSLPIDSCGFPVFGEVEDQQVVDTPAPAQPRRAPIPDHRGQRCKASIVI